MMFPNIKSEFFAAAGAFATVASVAIGFDAGVAAGGIAMVGGALGMCLQR